MILVVISEVFENEEVIHGNILTFLIVMYFVSSFKLKPYQNKAFNSLNTFANVVQIVSIQASLILNRLDTEEQEEEDQEGSFLKGFLSVLIILINCLYFGFVFSVVLSDFFNKAFRLSLKHLPKLPGKL